MDIHARNAAGQCIGNRNSDIGRNETGHRPVIASNVAWPMELDSVVCLHCVMADVHITLLYPSYNFDRENASGEMPETHGNPFKMLGVRDSRGPRNRIAGECYQISLWKWSLGSDRVLYKYDGHIRKTIRQQLRGAVQA